MENQKLDEQFEVLSNALRIFPERVMTLRYYLEEVNDPEEGISNIESAFRDVLNQFYGMVGVLKEEGIIPSLYVHDSFNTLLCLRHALQHGTGKVKNLFRDVILNQQSFEIAEVKYSASNSDIGRCPYLISAEWLENGVKASNYANKWQGIDSLWNISAIKSDVKSKGKQWSHVYLDGTILIAQAMSELVKLYGRNIKGTGFDSGIYLEHFKVMVNIDSDDREIIFT
ncbi:hypothetical protein G8G17_003369 [Vibrio cholerae]|nr:hypothetical protein [Vibrio cholerae]